MRGQQQNSLLGPLGPDERCPCSCAFSGTLAKVRYGPHANFVHYPAGVDTAQLRKRVAQSLGARAASAWQPSYQFKSMGAREFFAALCAPATAPAEHVLYTEQWSRSTPLAADLEDDVVRQFRAAHAKSPPDIVVWVTGAGATSQAHYGAAGPQSARLD